MKKILCIALTLVLLSGCTQSNPVGTAMTESITVAENVPVPEEQTTAVAETDKADNTGTVTEETVEEIQQPEGMPEQLALKVSETELTTRFPWLLEYSKEVTEREVLTYEVLEAVNTKEWSYLDGKNVKVNKDKLSISDYMYALYLYSEYIYALENDWESIYTTELDWEAAYPIEQRNAESLGDMICPYVADDAYVLKKKFVFLERQLAVLSGEADAVVYPYVSIGTNEIDGVSIKTVDESLENENAYGMEQHYVWCYLEGGMNTDTLDKLWDVRDSYKGIQEFSKYSAINTYWYAQRGSLTDPEYKEDLKYRVVTDDIQLTVMTTGCAVLQPTLMELSDGVMIESYSLYGKYYANNYRPVTYGYRKHTGVIKRNADTKEQVKDKLIAEGYLVYDTDTAEYNTEDWVYTVMADWDERETIQYNPTELAFDRVIDEDTPVSVLLSINKRTETGIERVDLFFEKDGVSYCVTFENIMEYKHTLARPSFYGAYKLYKDREVSFVDTDSNMEGVDEKWQEKTQ